VTGFGASGRSQHSSDQLISELIQTTRTAEATEIVTIIQHISQAGFNAEMRAVPRRDRGYSYQGYRLGVQAPSLRYHLTKRVVIERQWARGTTAAQYLADLHAAVLVPSAQLAVYEYGPEAIAAILALTAEVLPAVRRGAQPERYVLVIYSALRGTITTGYQVSSVGATSIPAGARWLR
jgi:hypothetical protein